MFFYTHRFKKMNHYVRNTSSDCRSKIRSKTSMLKVKKMRDENIARGVNWNIENNNKRALVGSRSQEKAGV